MKYEEYIVNGVQIPIPKDIEFKDITSFSDNIYWKIDSKDINKEDIKYKIEKKEENKNYIKVYEGNNANVLVNDLIPNTNYQFRICSIYKEDISEWTDNHKIKTKEFSSILDDCPKKEEFIKKLKEWSGFKNIELIYRGTKDGGDNNTFHNKCDNKGPNLILCKNDKGNIFGGYSSISWTSDNNGYKYANNSFLFTLTNIYNTQLTKFQIYNNNNHVFHNSYYGPIFGDGNDLYFYGKFFLNDKNGYCNCNFPHTYQDTLGKGKSIFTGDDNNNNTRFKLIEIEVFKLS